MVPFHPAQDRSNLKSVVCNEAVIWHVYDKFNCSTDQKYKHMFKKDDITA